ncbi:hypothetical protein EDD98_7679 [Streptomyces sp. PanSC19]|uniref:helix-turn-helix domain-containing protein n=1 Tax=Streptomyces sp. PanSC19 TaxID=1520455 RepID=UPI000F96402C|nr:helix-turn-helix domain-containing protein [Streptomyces sp. PanSC19]ROQ23230.1 hypothetical protein EDD98_7679 [Streptomyces sp. PanSC19]
MRLVESPHYSDAALSVYMKVKALGLRPEGCTAGVATLASYLGVSPSTVQRGLAQLRATAPDGVVELPDSRRRSLPGGCGTTARRRVRPLRPTERFVWLPVAASEHLRPRLLRAYAVISYAVVRGIPLTEGALADFLRHHSGRRVGQALTAEAAGRIVDQLAASGWISVRRRAGSQGRHLFLVPDQQAALSSVLDDRSGSHADERSLANKEDLRIDRLENDAPSVSPAVGELPVDKAVDDHRATPRPAETPGDHALRAGGKTPAPSPTTHNAGANPYRGPRLTFSARLHAVLAPVRFLLPEINTYVQRRIGQEIARQLDDGTEVQRLRARLTQRLAQTLLADIRDPGRWLLGVALPRWGCADPDCETGTRWSTGTECRACRETLMERAEARREPTAVSGTALPPETGPHRIPAARPEPTVLRIVECCPDCDRPHLPGNSGPCASCRPHPTPVQDPATAATGCRGRGGTCGRPAPRGLCWRCRIESEAESRPAEPKSLPTGTKQAPHL